MAKIFLIEDGNYSKRIEEASSGHNVFKYSSVRELGPEIVAKKPQLIFVPAKTAYSAAVSRLLKEFSFIPFAAYGEFGKTPAKTDRKMRKLLSAGFASCATVQTIIEKDRLLDLTENVLWKGLAEESIWDKERSITLEDRRSEMRRNVSVAVVVVAAVALLGFVFRDKIIPEKRLLPKMYSIPYSALSGLAVKGDVLWGCDWKSQSIYEQSARQKLLIKHVFSFPEVHFAGIALGDGKMWTLDSWNKKINLHKFDEKLSIVQEIDCPGDSPNSLTFDGTYLLVSDGQENKVYILRPPDADAASAGQSAASAVIKDFALPGAGVTGIYSDGKFLWVMDSQDNKLYKCKFSDFELKTESVFIPPAYENFRASVISGDSDYLWLGSEKENRIFRYPKKFLETL